MRKSILLVLAALALLVGSAFAQTLPLTTSDISVNGSYQFSRMYVNGAVENTDPGYSLSLNIPVFKSFGLLTEMTATTDTVAGTELWLKTYGEGIQYQPWKGKFIRPYANVVVGDAHFVYGQFTQNKFAVTTGAGVDIAISKHWAVRGGLEYLHTGLDTYSMNGVRPIAGLTFRF
jgi:opacity protein-like surface antigen